MLLVNDDDELQSLERRRLTADLIFTYRIIFGLVDVCLQCFDAVGWAAGRASGLLKHKSGGVLAWLSVWSEVQTCIRPS